MSESATKGPNDKLPEKLNRRLHQFDFRGKPAWMRVPTADEAIQAQIKSAAWVAGQAGRDEPVDPDIWTVDAATAFLIGTSFVDRDGEELMTGRVALATFTQDELLELLHHLSAARLAESKNPPLVDDDEVAQIAITLTGCNELDAYDVFAGVDHEHMARIALGLARLLKTEAARVAPLDDLATT